MNKVVILDDEIEVVEVLRILLEQANFKVYSFYSAEEFLFTKEKFEKCIYIVDAKLPGIQGDGVIKTIRYKDKISPIFMISGSVCPNQISTALKSGADDYILKPFHIESLMAKVENAHRKNSYITAGLADSEFKKFPEVQTLMRNGKFSRFTMSEYNIVEYLLLAPDKIKTRKDIIEASTNLEITERTIDVHIHAIRKKLLHLGMKIETIRGSGYKIIFDQSHSA
jgi:DNA-binding response OmpR family regulator